MLSSLPSPRPSGFKIERQSRMLLIFDKELLAPDSRNEDETLLLPSEELFAAAGLVLPELAPLAAEVAGAPQSLPVILPPIANVRADDRRWFSGSSAFGSAHGCASHRGPRTQDKENEDFAFSMELKDPRGDIWLCCGVADGVGDSTWSARGSQQASAGFLEAMTQLVSEHADVVERIQERDFLVRRFVPLFCDSLKRRHQEDEQAILHRRMVHPSWNPELYATRFLDGAQAVQERQQWFQSTLLAAVLGPHGGFALFLGDGYARSGRRTLNGEWQRRPHLLGRDDGGSPELCVTRWLTADEVGRSVATFPVQDSEEIEILLTTDGAVCSDRTYLNNLVLRDETSCLAALEHLARLPQGQVPEDNMSMAFARRSVSLGGT